MAIGCQLLFYMCWNPKYAVLMLISTLITYFSGILMEKTDTASKRKAVLLFSLISNLGILAVFKYFNFLFGNINEVIHLFNKDMSIPLLNVILPVGISFYTFQALGYSIDVYRKDTPAEHNFIVYALFISFFPQLVWNDNYGLGIIS